MKLSELIAEIRKLKPVEQHRLKEFFITSLSSSASEPVFQEINERKNKDGYTCIHCSSNQVVRFGKYTVKVGTKDVERQRYRCKDCKKTFTDVTNTPLYRTHKPNKWIESIIYMLEGYSLRKSADLIRGVHLCYLVLLETQSVGCPKTNRL
ncbi:transposase-like protein [Sporosarcina sp. JAI121]|nr:transposase-like protein [Sporosarcina sp. JAI121]